MKHLAYVSVLSGVCVCESAWTVVLLSFLFCFFRGYPVAQLVETLRYKSEGRGFDSQWCHSGRTMALGLAQPLTEISTRNISRGVKGAGA